ncbi:MAG: hypothetical protein Ct9H90mP20_2680 [Candidatus Neomarinimicrobiota bacterium]|nr:MAG: hypothetical protein Ct9H90mP20_2680 [Candidatus Neomarinimicrobiota bacterium]
MIKNEVERMEYITLGKTQSSVSKISLGTWSYGGAATSGSNRRLGDQDDPIATKTSQSPA